MKIELTDVSGLPDALKDLVTTEGDTSTLDLAQLAPASEVDKWKNKAVTAQDESIDRRKKLDAWKALGESPEAVQEALAAKSKGNPDHDKIIADLKKAHETALAEANERVTGTYKRTAASELKAELAKAGFIPDAIDDIAATALGRLQFNDDGTPKVLSQDGSGPMIGSGSNGGATLSDLAKELAQTKSYAVADSGKGGGGKPPQSNGGTPAKSWDEMTSGEKVRLHQTNPAEYERLKAAG